MPDYIESMPSDIDRLVITKSRSDTDTLLLLAYLNVITGSVATRHLKQKCHPPDPFPFPKARESGLRFGRSWIPTAVKSGDTLANCQGELVTQPLIEGQLICITDWSQLIERRRRNVFSHRPHAEDRLVKVQSSTIGWPFSNRKRLVETAASNCAPLEEIGLDLYPFCFDRPLFFTFLSILI